MQNQLVQTPSHCPLCNSRATERLECFPKQVLIEAGRRELKLDLTAELSHCDLIYRDQCRQCQLIYFPGMRQGSADFYHQLSQQHWYQPNSKFEYETAAKFIKSGDRVLDIGCGDGRFQQHIPNAHYQGLEPHLSQDHQTSPSISPESLERHRQQFSEFYDCVCAFQVLEHQAEPTSFLRDALGCLRPGGQLILGVPNYQSYVGQLMNFALNAPPHHLTWWSLDPWQQLVTQFGLTSEQHFIAPVEQWERALFWMARSYRAALPKTKRFSHTRLWSYLIPAGYVLGLLATKAGLPVEDYRGATMVGIATKPGV